MYLINVKAQAKVNYLLITYNITDCTSSLFLEHHSWFLWVDQKNKWTNIKKQKLLDQKHKHKNTRHKWKNET